MDAFTSDTPAVTLKQLPVTPHDEKINTEFSESSGNLFDQFITAFYFFGLK